MTWRELEHTADMGLHIEASNLEELLEECRRALYSYLPYEVPDQTIRSKSWTVFIQAVDLEDLFICWLNELIFLWDAHLSVFIPTYVQFEPQISRLSVNGKLIPQTGGTSPFKAATYGGTLLEKGPPVALTVFFDV
jgi:SHS2 domain-containing protein